MNIRSYRFKDDDGDDDDDDDDEYVEFHFVGYGVPKWSTFEDSWLIKWFTLDVTNPTNYIFQMFIFTLDVKNENSSNCDGNC